MQPYKTRKELKQEAKSLLKGNWKQAILLNLIPTLFIIATTLIIYLTFFIVFNISIHTYPSGNTYIESQTSTSGSGSGGGIGSFILSFFYIGISFTFLDWLRNPTQHIHPLKDATQIFSKPYFIPVFIINLLTYIFTFLWGLLFIIPGIIKGIAYSQSFFIYKDLSASSDTHHMKKTDFITESRALMHGHKWRYFVLQLSFIGWHILSILTFGIGYLWLNPYLNATLAAFYKDLAKDRYIGNSIA